MIYKTENSVDGIITCLYHSFLYKEYPSDVVCQNFSPTFFENVKEIAVDKEAVKRVRLALLKYDSFIFERVYIAFRYGKDEKFKIIFDFLHLTLAEQKSVIKMFGNEKVLAFNDITQKVWQERHRFLGFLRFIETASGVLYANFTPDNDIADLLSSHFIKRMNLPFIIHDSKRNKMVLFNGKDVKTVISDVLPTVILSKDEEKFTKLFKLYFNSVNIKERKNTRLQNGYLPKRYRKNMTEFKN